MDRTAMQNLFLYGNNASGIGSGGAGQQGGVANNYSGGGSSENEQQIAQALQAQQLQAQSGYPMLGMGYMGGAAAHAHAAAAMAEQRLYQEGFSGFPQQGGACDGAGAPGDANGTSQFSSQTQQSSHDPMMGGVVPTNGHAQNGGGSDAQSYMDANRMLMQRLSNQQVGGVGNGMPGGMNGMGMRPQQWMNYGMPQGAGAMGDFPQDMRGGGMGGVHGRDDGLAHGQHPGNLAAPWSSNSAGLLSKMNPQEEKKKVVRRKHKDKPKRPLSAYNIFFKEERQRILASIPTKAAGEDAAAEGKDKNEETEIDDKTGKRKRKKTPHGKIGFENLAKIIGQRWQELKGDRITYYKGLAAEDMKRYKEQMEIFLTKQEMERKRENGELPDAIIKNSALALQPDPTPAVILATTAIPPFPKKDPDDTEEDHLTAQDAKLDQDEDELSAKKAKVDSRDA